MAVIGGFRSDLSITRMTDRNFGNVPRVFCFPKLPINENGGNPKSTLLLVKSKSCHCMFKVQVVIS